LLWIVATVIASLAQVARNAMQISLTASLGTIGATQVRFLYGFPFALVFLALLTTVSQSTAPAPNLRFFAFTFGGAFAQIFGNSLLLAAMRERSFSVVTAFNKTEAVQVAVFGLLILGDELTLARAAAVLVATAGVFLIAVKAGEKWGEQSLRPTLFGIASGGLYAIAAVGYRGGILALDDALYFIRASTTLAWALGFQALLLGAWMIVYRREALLKSLTLWRQSLFAGFMGAFASQFWFLGFSLTAAANVRTLGLIEVLFAQVVSRRVFRERTSAREITGMALVVVGVAALLLSQ